MYVLHRSCAFTNGGGHTLHRSETNVADSEYSRHAGFKAHWLSCQRPFAQIDIVSCHDKIFRTTLDRRAVGTIERMRPRKSLPVSISGMR